MREPDEPDQFKPPPLDVVFTWCDESDPVFQSDIRRYRTASQSAEAAGSARFRTYDELRYSLRALDMHAPWIRNVILVTNDQTPHWLDRGAPGVRVVSHRDLFEDHSHLPCFNSLAIEMSLHRIPDLSEWFLYFNDDFFIGNTLSPRAFFSPEGRPLFFVENYPLPAPRAPWFPGRDEDLMKRCHRYNHRLLRALLPGLQDARDPTHTPQLYEREGLRRLARHWANEIRATQACRFREPHNTKLAVLYPSFVAASAEPERRCLQRTIYNGSSEYLFRTVRDRDVDELERWLAEIEAERPNFFCVNDAVEAPSVVERMLYHYRAMLERMFPRPSRWEQVLP